MGRIARIGQVLVAALFSAVLVTFWVMMALYGRGEWLTLDRAFRDSGMYVDMHSLLQLTIIGVPICTIAALRALQMFGKFRPHEGVRFTNRIFLGMGLASIIVAASYFGLWDDVLSTASGGNTPPIAPPSDEKMPYPSLPLTMALEMQDLSGNTVQLGDLKGKVVFLNIWATWCTFCKLEFPNIQRLYDALKDDPRFAFVLVSEESAPVVEAWLQSPEAAGLSLPFYTAKDLGRYNPDGYPTTYIIGPDGQTAFTHSGFAAWDGERTRKFLMDLAEGK